MRSAVALAALALALAALPSSHAVAPPWHACGALSINVANPDLQPSADGAIHASGQVLMQFTVAGKGAENVTSMFFDLGEALPDAVASCTTPLGSGAPVSGSPTGAYVFTRSDLNPHDGFAVALNTSAFPDGTYGAAIRAVDASGAEVARTYGAFTIANTHDNTRPWPLILPGDGVGSTNPSGHGVTIEFVEPVSNVLATRNGEPLTLTKWTPPPRADDLSPENPVDNTPTQTKVWGPGFQANVSVAPGDTLRVVATDAVGNVADKTVVIPKSADRPVTILDANASRAPPEPRMTLDASAGDTRDVNAGDTTQWNVRITNHRSVATNVSLDAGGPLGLDSKVEPSSVLVAPNDTATVTVTARADPQLAPGTYSLRVTALWKNASATYADPATLDLTVNVHAPPAPSSAATTEPEQTGSTGATAGAAKTPGPDALVAVVGLAAVANLFARTRAMRRR
ncbi:MAG: COG1470 family protein [Thermoplasmatota archaeon]